MATTMYPPQNNSPHTTLAANINAVSTSITVDDGSILPAAPNALTIGLGEDAELVLMTAKTGDILTVERGYNDTTAKDWMAGDWMYRAITAQDIKALQDNIAAASATDLAASLTAAGWTGASAPYTQTVSGLTGITATSKLDVGLAETASDAEFDAAVAAQIRATASGTGTVSFKAHGTKPTLALPIIIRMVN